MPVRKKSRNPHKPKRSRKSIKRRPKRSRKKSVKGRPVKRKPVKRKTKLCSKVSTKKKRITRKPRGKVFGGQKYISQKEPYDCVVACLSMFVDKPYSQIKNKYFKNQDFSHNTSSPGVGYDKEVEVLKLEGYTAKDISPELPPRNAIVTVPSLNYENSLHAVFWDGLTIFDPNTAHSNNSHGTTKIYTHMMFLNEPEKHPIVSTF